jgi:hypothetical protein
LPLEIGREHIRAEETQVSIEILQDRSEDRDRNPALGCTPRKLPGCADTSWIIVSDNQQVSDPFRQNEPGKVSGRESGDHSGRRHDSSERENGFDPFADQKRARGMVSIIRAKPDTMAVDMPQGAPGIDKGSLLAIGGQPTALDASKGASSVPDSCQQGRIVGCHAALIVAVVQSRVKPEISRIRRRQMPKAEVSLGQCARKRLAFVPDAPCDHRRIRSGAGRNIPDVANSGGDIWFSKKPPGLGQRFGKAAMSLSSGQEIEEIAMLARRSVLPFAPRAFTVRHSGEPDEE